MIIIHYLCIQKELQHKFLLPFCPKKVIVVIKVGCEQIQHNSASEMGLEQLYHPAHGNARGFENFCSSWEKACFS